MMSNSNNASPSRIPKPNWLRHSNKTPKIQRHQSLQTLNTYEKDDDCASEKSFGSTTSSQCDNGHSMFALNGTTYSSRKKAYLHYCPSNIGSEEYLTPTQRSSRTIRNLRRLLNDAHSELNDKDTEIDRLKKENIELKVKCGYETANDSIAEGNEDEDTARFIPSKEQTPELDSTKLSRSFLNPSPSPADSGHGDEYDEAKKLRQAYDELREKHNDKIEELLKRLGELHEKYYGLKPLLDEAYIRIKELEMENDFLKWSKTVPDNTKTAIDQTSIDHIKKTFCDVLTQTQSVLQLDKKTETDQTHHNFYGAITENIQNSLHKSDSDKNHVIPTQTQQIVCLEKDTETNGQEVEDSIDELSNVKLQLKKTKAMYETILQQQLEQQRQRPIHDAEMTLQFLKSAFYYYLTDPSNTTGHLNAILSILRYSDAEKKIIERNQAWK
ncbi:calponin homology domain-containing protein DDB_G0272472 isoform X3 [Acyrthosiphon pisum]|uniref:GRIP domain-containing protein n=1 Tax=Acyrthosiphon pisum TaxID=7029 RepID=A0A8R1WAA3_ACYPI|nr:calponin homology domain-containing protein DDB_G0272472 isoform X3 [Acyrthosiphon pisum]|eukprot:XP_003242908.1 PREDICTED: calponin homology domain-containing protein DDB_G0272472 isoform X3 [Acyrthosiphon pisum]